LIVAHGRRPTRLHYLNKRTRRPAGVATALGQVRTHALQRVPQSILLRADEVIE
jgi:hypothetical protein